MKMKIAIINVTKIGNDVADKIKENINIDLYSKYDSCGLQNNSFDFKDVVDKTFKNYNAIVFISSTGIAVRSIASFIKSKDKDPAVIVIDSIGRYVISLLSGHLGGANDLTNKIAKIIEAEPIITTATDNLNVEAPDVIAKKNNLVIGNLKDAKKISALLVNGEKVAFIDEENLIKIPRGYESKFDKAQGIVCITNKYKLEKNEVINKNAFLKLIRKNIVLGIGCRKNYDAEIMKNNVVKVLKEENIDLNSIKTIVSVDIKKEEKALIELSSFLNCKFQTYSVEEIKKVEKKFNRSEFVKKTIGVGAVCEPCIYLRGAKIIKEKQKLNGMTLAIGKL